MNLGEIPNMTNESKELVSDTLHVYIPGITGGGKLNTSLRDQLHSIYGNDIYVLSSISSKEGALLDNVDHDHPHKIQAERILSLANGRNIDMTLHSMGGFEGIDILNTMLKSENSTSLEGKTVRLNFAAVPGFTKKGFEGLCDIGKKLSIIGNTKKVTELEHMSILPFPTQDDNHQKPTVAAETIFIDSHEKQELRRKRFLDVWLPQVFKNSPTQLEIFRNKLDAIDAQICDAIEQKVTTDGLNDIRVELLTPVLQLIFQGKHLPEELHTKMLDLYEERTNTILRPTATQTLLYLGRVATYGIHMADYLSQGMPKILKNIIDEAKRKNVRVGLAFTLFENDMMIPLSEAKLIEDNIVTNDLYDALEGLYFAQTAAHSSIGYDADFIRNNL